MTTEATLDQTPLPEVASRFMMKIRRIEDNRLFDPPMKQSQIRTHRCDTNLNSKSTATLLPETFVPSQYTVIIGRSKESKEAAGNHRLRAVVISFIEKYSAANTKSAKSEIVSVVVKMVRKSCEFGAFVRHGDQKGRWYEADESVAREKVGYVFRDILSDRYRSSSASKTAKRRHLQKQHVIAQHQLVWQDQQRDQDLFQKLLCLTNEAFGKNPSRRTAQKNHVPSACSLSNVFEDRIEPGSHTSSNLCQASHQTLDDQRHSPNLVERREPLFPERKPNCKWCQEMIQALATDDYGMFQNQGSGIGF